MECRSDVQYCTFDKEILELLLSTITEKKQTYGQVGHSTGTGNVSSWTSQVPKPDSFQTNSSSNFYEKYDKILVRSKGFINLNYVHFIINTNIECKTERLSEDSSFEITQTCRVLNSRKCCARCTHGRCTSHVVAHDCELGPGAEGQRPVPIAERSLADSCSLHTANKLKTMSPGAHASETDSLPTSQFTTDIPSHMFVWAISILYCNTKKKRIHINGHGAL